LSGSAENRDPLDELGEEFLERLRRGERPSVSAFVARDPVRAQEIREFLSALVLVEGLKPQAQETVGAGWAGPVGLGPGLERLGDFRVLRELGRGGMGVVYEAEQESLGRRVALKVLAPSVSRTPQQIRRFVREARAAARLHHTNIVPVFGVGEHDGLHYYAMQCIPGLGLDKVLNEVRRLKGHRPPRREGDASSTRLDTPDASATLISNEARGFGHALPADRAGDDEPSRPSTLAADADSDARYARGVARIGLQVAEALEYAHQQGTLHRDVKPSNILLDVHGVAWVTDFGLAKAAEDDDLTRTGDLVGTVRYMAPERFRGRGDGRSDVYGLGLVLYELLALEPAFGASDRERLLHQVSHVEPARLREINPAVPRDLETIVHKAIEKDAAHRYATAALLADDLRRFLEDRPIVARRVGSTERLTRWARRNPGLATLGTALAAMLALVVVVIAAADLRLRREHADTLFHLGRAERAEAEVASKLLDSYLAQARASRQTRFAGRRSEGLRAIGEAARLDTMGSRRLELRNEAIACLALPDLRPLGHWPGRPEDGYLGVDFDPASGRLARGTPDGAVLIHGGEEKGEPTRLPGNGLRAVLLRFGPHGHHLAVKHEEGGKVILAVWDVRRRVKVLDLPDGTSADAVDFHPDCRTLAAGRSDGSIAFYDLAAGRELRRLLPGTVPQTIRFDPSGRWIAVVGPNAREGVQVRQVDDGSVVAAWSLADSEYAAAWHASGRWLAVGTHDGRIRLLDPRNPARAPRMFEGHDGQVVGLAFHPGGTLLASASWDGTLLLWDFRTGQELVKASLPESRPIRFSHDGRLLGPGHDVGTSWLWEVTEGIECRSLVGEQGTGANAWWIDFLEAGGVLVSAGAQGVRFDLTKRDNTPAFAPMAGTSGVVTAPDGSSLITSGKAGLLRWPVRRPFPAELHIGPPRPLGPLAGVPTGRIALSRDAQTLATVIDGERGRVLVFDLKRGGPPVELADHRKLERLAISPDGHYVATGTWQGTHVKVWDARRGVLTRELPIDGSAEVVFSPDGRQLVTASATEYAIWEAGTWAERLRIPRNQAGGLPGVAAFTADGYLLAIARSRNTVQLINPATGRELATLGAPEPQNLVGLGFSPDGRLLTATFNTPRIQVWDLAAIRGELGTLDLDWSAPTATAPQGAVQSGPQAIAIEQAPWLEPLERGESFARSGCWDQAASAFDHAIALGAPHVDAQACRVRFLLARGYDSAYSEACRELLSMFDATNVGPRTLNVLAWSCAQGPAALTDYAALIRVTESAIASARTSNRLNTLGALLYRAGRFEDAIQVLERSRELHGAGGTPFDALFLAMAHHRLGHREEAQRWLGRGTAPAAVAMFKRDASGDTSWISRLDLQMLREEATALLGLAGP
jgi:serine/threonine protein kinase/WD40 repeat protein